MFTWQYTRDSIDQEDIDDLEDEGILAHHPIVFKNSFDIVSHETKQAPYRTTEASKPKCQLLMELEVEDTCRRY